MKYTFLFFICVVYYFSMSYGETENACDPEGNECQASFQDSDDGGIIPKGANPEVNPYSIVFRFLT